MVVDSIRRLLFCVHPPKVNHPTHEPQCWICFEACSQSDIYCKCPERYVHRSCLVRWQFERSGTIESTKCRFCSGPLDDWKDYLITDEKIRAAMSDEKYNVNIQFVYNDNAPETISMNQPLEEMMATLKQHLTRGHGQTHMCFQVEHPITRKPMHLVGTEHFETALFCARVKCARRGTARGVRGLLAHANGCAPPTPLA